VTHLHDAAQLVRVQLRSDYMYTFTQGGEL